MIRAFLRPGQGFQPFIVLRRANTITGSGRPVTGELQPAGKILGIISQASQKEQEQWKQNGHPITHTIVQRGTAERGRADDVLQLIKPGADHPRQFLVQGTHDPGELGHFTIYYVQEREDLRIANPDNEQDGR